MHLADAFIQSDLQYIQAIHFYQYVKYNFQWYVITLMLQKISISNKCCFLNFPFIKESIANQHIRIISKGSCDTEDFYNDAENSALLLQNYITIH